MERTMGPCVTVRILLTVALTLALAATALAQYGGPRGPFDEYPNIRSPEWAECEDQKAEVVRISVFPGHRSNSYPWKLTSILYCGQPFCGRPFTRRSAFL